MQARSPYLELAAALPHSGNGTDPVRRPAPGLGLATRAGLAVELADLTPGSELRRFPSEPRRSPSELRRNPSDLAAAGASGDFNCFCAVLCRTRDKALPAAGFGDLVAPVPLRT